MQQYDQNLVAITYRVNPKINSKQVSELFDSSGIRRPTKNSNRIKRMIKNANLIVCAKGGAKLVGILRAVTDFSYCCYVSDIAVHENYQKFGIGTKLLKTAQKKLGREVMILLLSAPESDSFYSHIGMDKVSNAWKIPRKK